MDRKYRLKRPCYKSIIESSLPTGKINPWLEAVVCGILMIVAILSLAIIVICV